MKEEQTHPDRTLADDLIRKGQYADAATLYRRLTELFPDEDSHLLALAWALHDAGRRQEAADCFERLFRKEIARNMFTGFAYDELVRMYREEKNGNGLVSVCERAVAAQPEDVGLLKTLGEAYLAAGRPGDAVRVLEQLTFLEADAPENWCALGNAWIAAGDAARAEAAYIKAAEIDPADAPVFYSRLADRLLRAGYPPNAQAALERCLALKPGEPLYLMALGDILIRRGKPDDAVEAYARAASLNPASAGVLWFRLGNLFEKEGLHACGMDAFMKAVAAEPGNPRYLLGLASSYAAQGLTDLARATLSRAEKIMGTASGVARRP